jgi:hypothetical protein
LLQQVENRTGETAPPQPNRAGTDKSLARRL